MNVGVVWLYTTLYQRVDEEEFGGLWEMVKEGLMTAFALFLVSTILVCVCVAAVVCLVLHLLLFRCCGYCFTLRSMQASIVIIVWCMFSRNKKHSHLFTQYH